jgi:hypothetical protein
VLPVSSVRRCRSKGDYMLTFLKDPRIFSYIIMTLYGMNVIRWGYEHKWADVCYWLSAMAITATVTFGYKH